MRISKIKDIKKRDERELRLPLTHEEIAELLGGLTMRLDEEGEGRAKGHGGGGAQFL